MTLPSNGGGTEFNPTNDNTRYKVRLPNRLVLKEQDWEVALVSLSFPIRDHHKHHILSNFPRGTVVTKVYGTVPDSPYIHIDILGRLGQYLGIIDRSLNEGKNIRHYERGRDVNTNTGPAGFRRIEYINNTPYIELYGSVNWEIIGLDNGWFEQAFSSKYRVVRILTNICDSSVVVDDRTNVLGEAKVDAVMAEGQQYYEPTHLRYVPLRERELDVIEIILDDLNGSIVDLGIGITSVVLYFKRRGDIKSGHNC